MTYKDMLLEAFKEGLLLLVKWGLLIAAIVYAFNYSLQTRNMALNGNQAAIAINELQQKGWLPKFKDGVIPDRDGGVK